MLTPAFLDVESVDTVDAGSYFELGTIRATLQTVMDRKVRHSRSYGELHLPGDRPIDEKSKKAGAHAAR